MNGLHRGRSPLARRPGTKLKVRAHIVGAEFKLLQIPRSVDPDRVGRRAVESGWSLRAEHISILPLGDLRVNAACVRGSLCDRPLTAPVARRVV